MATVTANITNSNSVTITLNSVTDTSTALSNAIDNSTNKFVEIVVRVKVKTGAAASATGYINVYIVRSTDGGTDYSDSTDELIGTMPAIATATTYARAFRVALPGTHFKIAVENRSGGTTDTTAGNHECEYSGVKFDIA